VRRRRTALTVLIGLVIGLSPGVPALASSPADIDALVTDYFVQADQAWYGTTPQAFSAGRLRGGRIAPAARHLAITTASIARDARRLDRLRRHAGRAAAGARSPTLSRNRRSRRASRARCATGRP
jgi:hypothetical protein